MLTPLLFLTLYIFTNSLSVYSGPSTTTVQYPLYSQTILQKSYSIADPNPMEYGTNWIWSNGTTKMATFQTLFYARMGPVDISIKANNTYYAFLNGVSIRTGYKYQSESTTVMLSCGLNNLTIKAENTDSNAISSGLIFRINQFDYMAITTCNNNGFFNYSTCSCQCSGIITCLPTQQFANYPICGCKCGNQASLNCNSNVQYFDQQSCICKCVPIYCRQGFEMDPITCNCRCIVKICSTGYWNYNQCRCL